MLARVRLPLAAALLLLLSSGCAEQRFRKAVRLEESKQYAEAVRAYEGFLENHPEDGRVAEAACRAGRIQAEVFGRCEQAVPLLERAARLAGGDAGPWPERARLALISCPDYFPIRAGSSWRYVDTLSGGANMHLDVQVTTATAGVHAVIAGSLFAGETRFKGYRRVYTKEGWTVWETQGKNRLPILIYPFNRGREWSVEREGKRVRFAIVASGIEVGTKAGAFKGCLKIKTRTEGLPSWVYDYYCPGVGRVKTSIGVPGVENPNTELAAYDIPKGRHLLQ